MKIVCCGCRLSNWRVVKRNSKGLVQRCCYTARAKRYPKLAGLEEKDCDLTEVEVDEMLGLVGNVGAEVAAHDGVPGGVVLFVEFLLDEGGDVLLDVVLFEGLGSAVDGVLPVTKISKLQCNEHRTS